ncbi:MAG: NHLP leader peptide family natural product precursor [Candidatus Riflebacteria bacterium]|nr:NHLP leader peptide family natural product precursor [Candidatus Riflebacteria bacterium]
MTSEEFERELIKRAMADESFRRKLMDDPTGTISAELSRLRPGSKLADGLVVKTIEEKPGTMCLVIPPPQAAGTCQLSDEDLDQVSGGLSGWHISKITTTIG